MSSQHVPSSLSHAAPRPASHRRPFDRKHPFPSGSRSQISPDLSGLSVHRARSLQCRLVDQKRPFPFPGRSQTPGSPELFGPFLHRAHSQLRSGSSRRVPSLHRFASRASPEAWPRSRRVVLGPRAFFQGPAFSLLVTIAGLAVAPSLRQPVPANSLSVNW